ncbi:MAG: hypothetical protein LC708_01245, partial [Actinobacteria bacterium]|nr:hypothetical protein [Actinomycetota bacterium]
GSDTVSVIDTATHTVVATVAVGELTDEVLERMANEAEERAPHQPGSADGRDGRRWGSAPFESFPVPSAVISGAAREVWVPPGEAKPAPNGPRN